ncbi:hypothetical protein REPUB_Repub08aG0233600 [Reevesia pubescens]
MSSTNVGSEQTGSNEQPPLFIQEIIQRITELRKRIEEEADSPQQTTAADNQTGTEQDGSTTGDASQENKDTEQDGSTTGDASHGNKGTEQDGSTPRDASQGNKDATSKQDGDVSQENKDETSKRDGDVSQENKDKTSKQEGVVSQEIKNTDDGRCCPGVTLYKKGKEVGQENHVQSNKKDEEGNKKKPDERNKKEEVRHELGKLCKELQYMISSFEKLKNFENKLREPLKTLEDNVNDILKDLPQVKEDELPKQVPVNLRVLRNNITKVKIQIPLQHQTANTNSEANRALQTTVATTEADLPHLYNEGIFKSSYYFKEIEEKYNELDDRQKLCLLCFAIFPENAEIKKRLLRFWWAGEDLFRDKDPKDEMKLVSETLEKFVEKGFIEPILKKNKLQPRSYKMNPIVRSCVIKFADADEARFFDYDSEGKPTMDFSICKKACMVKSEGAHVDWFSKYLKDPGPDRLSADLVKLQMLFNFPDRDTLKDASEQFNELQTLFNISKQFPALPKEWFSKMTDLNVLYLGRWETSAGKQRHIEVEDIDFLRGLKNMKKLRLLSLQGISGIPRLPNTLCKLENLRILDLRACHNLEKLPDRIGALKELTYMDLSECYLIDDMPKQLNQLEKLQVLKGFVIGEGKNSCTLDDLSALRNLRKLSVNVNSEKFDIDDAGIALSKFKGLEKLKIAWGAGGLTKDSTEDNSSKKQSDLSNSSGGESKKHEKESVKSKTKNQKVNGNAAKSSTEKEIKGADKGNRENNAGEANSKTVNQEEDKKGQNVGATKSVASKVSERDNRKPKTSWKRATNFAMTVATLKLSVGRGETTKKPEGLEKLVKLDLQCFPRSTPPDWLVPKNMIGLTNLCIRGGKLGHLIQKDDEKWEVKTLRLKFLVDFKMNWKEMQERFPKLEYLEKVRCPRITFCPDASGVWQKSSK